MVCKFAVVIENDEYGCYAFCPELEGCQTQGDTVEEAIGNMKEAIGLYIETLTPEELLRLSSKQILTTALEVQVA